MRTIGPRWSGRFTVMTATEPQYRVTQADYDALSDAELHDIGMYRCECGTAVYPNGDPDWQHCDG